MLDSFLYLANPDTNELEELAHWRNHYQIHNWFVNNIQFGMDYGQCSYVPRIVLTRFINALETVTNNPSTANLLVPLPTSTAYSDLEYNSEYYDQVLVVMLLLKYFMEKHSDPYKEFVYMANR